MSFKERFNKKLLELRIKRAEKRIWKEINYLKRMMKIIKEQIKILEEMKADKSLMDISKGKIRKRNNPFTGA